MDARERQVSTWAEAAWRHAEQGDPFAAYVAAWLTLTIIAGIRASDQGLRGPDNSPSDSDLVDSLFRSRSAAVWSAVSDQTDHAKWLARRVGIDDRGREVSRSPIILVSPNEPLAARMVRLRAVLAGEVPALGYNVEDRAADLAALLNRVRNNLFHGRKIYEFESEDAELLQHLNPIALAIIDAVAGRRSRAGSARR